MIETLLGSLFGGLFRMMPEVLKWLDRKDERAHELSMFDKQLEADKLKADSAQQLLITQTNGTTSVAEIQAMIEATKSQSTLVGVKWVDAVSSLMRPTITFWWVIVMYSVALYAQYTVLIMNGAANTAAILQLWGTDEKMIVASIISFWFVDRSLRRGSKQ